MWFCLFIFILPTWEKKPFQTFVHTFDKTQNIYTLNGIDVKTLNDLFANIHLIIILKYLKYLFKYRIWWLSPNIEKMACQIMQGAF